MFAAARVIIKGVIALRRCSFLNRTTIVIALPARPRTITNSISIPKRKRSFLSILFSFFLFAKFYTVLYFALFLYLKTATCENKTMEHEGV